MNDRVELPDQIHIDRLCERLWCGREFGQAAIMIGAGFSRNAQPTSPSISPLPTWNTIAGAMFDALYPNTSQASNYRAKSIAEKGVLRLASEYEIAMGRHALDNLLRTSINDQGYLPGSVHRLMLTLHWSDVYTTNYDTLLERTLPFIHDRKYDVIHTIEDIPNGMKPRIVKLHGSFPSHRPFIITEDDFRTYPIQFAPFVNMVQQGIMENDLCLLGFSGDDPNFLQWSGWVRDNLGDNTPNIYLCGILTLNDTQKRLLQSRHVVPIDLSPLFPKDSYPEEGTRHRAAMEWFLLTLLACEPPRRINWPAPPIRRKWEPSYDNLPHIPSCENEGMIETVMPEPGRVPSQSEWGDLCTSWAKERKQHPGWIITPRSSRDDLINSTRPWIEKIIHHSDEVDAPYDLLLLYELNWRLETILLPLFMSWVKKIVGVLNKYNPYPSLLEVKDASIRPDSEEFKDLDWKWISEAWVELHFALAREAREDQDEARFENWMERISKVIVNNQEWQARWHYERCLFFLMRLDQEKVLEVINEWPMNPELAFWDVKRASILSELGELDEAETITREALSRIRSQQRPYEEDYRLFSQESYAMVLLKAIRDNDFKAPRDFVAEYQSRWEKLRQYRCDPWAEFQQLQSTIKGPKPLPKQEKEVIKGFDPGEYTVTRNLFAEETIEPYFPAFALLRMFEEAAVPIHCGSMAMFNEGVMSAASWIAPYAPLWSLSSIVRTNKEKEIKDWFNRVYLASLEVQTVDHLYNILIDSLQRAIQILEQNPKLIGFPRTSFSERRVDQVPEILSRICFRCSSDQLAKVYELALAMYRSPIFTKHHYLHDGVKVLFKRLLFVFTDEEIIARIPELLSLPIPSVDGFEVSTPQFWPEPFRFIKWTEDKNLHRGIDRSSWVDPINRLLKVVKSGSSVGRERAVWRLTTLLDIGSLTEEEIETFGDALWKRTDPVTQLPAEAGMMNSSFLFMPEPEDGLAKKRLRKYLNNADFPRVIQHAINSKGKKTKSMSFGGHENTYISDWIRSSVLLFPSSTQTKQKYVNWSKQEIVTLLKKAKIWWDEEKGDLADKRVTFAGAVRENFNQLAELMSSVILPRLQNADSESVQIALNLISEMDESGIRTFRALPMTLFINLDAATHIAQRIRIGLNSIERSDVSDAIIGLFRWTVHGKRRHITAPPGDLLDEWVNIVVSRRQPGLDIAIAQYAILARRVPDVLTKRQVHRICIALEYLIKETEITHARVLKTIHQISVHVPLVELPEYRKYSAELAHWIYVWHIKKQLESPNILENWRAVCQTDPLPEVRRAWPQNTRIA